MWPTRPLPRSLVLALRAHLGLLVPCLLSLLLPWFRLPAYSSLFSCHSSCVISSCSSPFSGLAPSAPPPLSFAPLPSLCQVAPAMPPAVCSCCFGSFFPSFVCSSPLSSRSSCLSSSSFSGYWPSPSFHFLCDSLFFLFFDRFSPIL